MCQKVCDKGNTEEKTVWQEQSEIGRLVGAAETSVELEEMHRFQQKNLSKLSLVKRVASAQKMSSWQGLQSRFCRKEKEQSHHEMGECQGEQELYLGEKEGGSKQEHGEERVSSTVKENEFQKGDEWQAVSLPCKSKRKHESVSGPKCFPGRSKKSCFHCKSGQT